MDESTQDAIYRVDDDSATCLMALHDLSKDASLPLASDALAPRGDDGQVIGAFI